MQRCVFDLNAASLQALKSLQTRSEKEGLRLRLSQIANVAVIQADIAQADLKDPGPWDREEAGQLTVFFSDVALEAMGRLRERLGWGPSRVLRASLVWLEEIQKCQLKRK